MTLDVNKVFIIGNVVKKPILNITKSTNSSVVTFHVSTSRVWISQGEKQQESSRHACIAWGKIAEICANRLEDGSKVYIEGRLQNTVFLDDKNEEKETIEVVVNQIIIFNSGEKPYADLE